MRIDTRLFHSILARRFFVLFVISALAPIAIFAVVAYLQAKDKLLEQSEYRLDHAAKTVSLSVYERLFFLQAELGFAAQNLGPSGSFSTAGAAEERLHNLFTGLAVVSTDGEASTIFGEVPAPSELTGEQLDHLTLGHGLLASLGEDAVERPILGMFRLLDPADPLIGVAVGVIAPNYLWGTSGENVVPFGVDLCAYDDARRLLFGSLEGCRGIAPLVAAQTVGTHRGKLDVRIGGEKFLAQYYNGFFKTAFGVETWSFVLVQSKVEALAPMRDFLWAFPLVVLVCFWVVLLLSSFAIRQSLVPLDRLTEGTRRIAERDFSTRVEIDSGDEFDNLADAFNTMSDRLQRQFRALATNAEIHRAILSTIDTTTIVETATAGALDTVDCDLVCVGVLGAGESNEVALFYSTKGNVDAVSGLTSRLSSWDIEMLSSGADSVVLNDDGGRSELLTSLPACADSIVLTFPVMLGSRLAAVLCLGRVSGEAFSAEDSDQGRQLADQVAVALSNANLIDELKELTWGTLEALARAIDAKSPWTAGHSGRVTAMSLKIARALGRNPEQLDVMHRGALMHDIGKLGISVQVLDKPDRLENDELWHVMEHPSIGGRILEPITAFSDIMPIVTDHHERWDGSGYPNGLAGEEIHINARILSVADTYDAMTSDRPYRKGRDPEIAISEICSQAGKQFDPKVVEAFLVVMGRDPKKEVVQPDSDFLGYVAGRGA